VAVQLGEGTIEIIYGSISIPAGAQTLSGYLARPDREGQWPTVLLFGPEPLPLSSVKNICRVFARHGIAVLAPDMTTNHELNTLVAASAAAFASDPSGAWSNAHLGYGVLAYGSGIYDSSPLAAKDGRVMAEASVAATLDDRVGEDMVVAGIPGLWVGSRSDESTNVDVSVAWRESLPRTTFVVHADSAAGFWNDDADEYEEKAATDTIDRLIAFFAGELPPRI
jgi:dienelactone hydrolase